MKWSAIVAIVVVAVVSVIWAFLFRASDKHPTLMPPLAGCYIPMGGNQSRKVNISTSGDFRYGNKVTSVVPYQDKQSLSLLPKLKIVVTSDGEVKFLEGNPLLLRIDSDKLGFTIPSESGAGLPFRKSGC